MGGLFQKITSGIRALPIWCAEAPAKQAYVLFRKPFELARKPQAASVQVSACDRYLLFLNGAYVGRGPAVGAGAARFYDVHEELAKRLVQGKNALAAMVYSHGPDRRNRIMDTLGCFVLRLAVEFDAAPAMDISTDTSWLACPAEAWRPAKRPTNDWGVGYPEEFDVAAMPAHWEMPDYDDSGWGHAILAHVSGYEWRPRPIPALRYELVAPVRIAETIKNGGGIKGSLAAGKRRRATGIAMDASAPGSLPQLLFDFGRIVSARPRLRLEVPKAGGVIEIAYGESRRLEPLDLLHLKAGAYEWGTLLPRAFRYLGVSLRNAPRPVRLLDVAAEVETFPFYEPSRFDSSDKSLAGIWEVAKNTLLASTRDYFMDCPGREQALWLGDTDREDAAALVLFGDERPGRHSLDLFALLQGKDGAVPAVGPLAGDAFIPDYHVQWPAMLWRHYVYSGDEEFVSERFPSLSRSLAWLERVLDRRDLVPQAERPEWWCFLDWQPALPRRGYVAALNMLAFSGFRCGALLAEALGRQDQASRWAGFAMRLDLAIKQAFYDAGRGLFCDLPVSEPRSYSQLANALAVVTGLLRGKEADRLCRRMHEASDLIPVQTPYSAYWYADALFAGNLKAAGCRFIEAYWGAMCERGATTYWETFDVSSPAESTPFASRDRVTSLCHGWGAAVAELLVRHILGIEALEPGFRRVRFAPYLEAAGGIDASIRLPVGCFKVLLKKGRTVGRALLELPTERELEVAVDAKGLKRLKLGHDIIYVKGGPVVLPPGLEKFAVQDGIINLALTTGKLALEYRC